MPREEYWNGDIFAAFDYAEANLIRMNNKNSEAWLQGLYNYAAFGINLANAFSKNGSEKKEYPDRPFEIFKNNEENNRSDDETEALKARLIMESIVNKFKHIGK